MSEKYRMEREQMVPGQVVPLYRVIVRLPGRGVWGHVQAGLVRPDAEALLARLQSNEARGQQERVMHHGGFRR